MRTSWLHVNSDTDCETHARYPLRGCKVPKIDYLITVAAVASHSSIGEATQRCCSRQVDTWLLLPIYKQSLLTAYWGKWHGRARRFSHAVGHRRHGGGCQPLRSTSFSDTRLLYRYIERQVTLCSSWKLSCTCCWLSASNNSCNWPSTQCSIVTFTLNFGLIVASEKLTGSLIHVYNMHSDFERGNYCQTPVHHNWIFTVQSNFNRNN